MKLYIFQQLWVSNEKWFKTQWTRNSFYHTYMQIPAPICKENILDIHTHTSQHKSWSIYLHAVVYLKSLKKGKLSRQWLACSSLHFVARKSVSREFCISMAKCVRCQFQANTRLPNLHYQQNCKQNISFTLCCILGIWATTSTSGYFDPKMQFIAL